MNQRNFGLLKCNVNTINQEEAFPVSASQSLLRVIIHLNDSFFFLLLFFSLIVLKLHFISLRRPLLQLRFQRFFMLSNLPSLLAPLNFSSAFSSFLAFSYQAHSFHFPRSGYSQHRSRCLHFRNPM
jgi:hypothetical protein